MFAGVTNVARVAGIGFLKIDLKNFPIPHRCPDRSNRLTGSPSQYAYAFIALATNGLKLSELKKRINSGLYILYP